MDRLADATVLAAAGLARLGIGDWAGTEFMPLEFAEMVPAVGQAAIGVQCRAADAAAFAAVLDADTARTVTLERAFQTALGAGCQTAFAAHATVDTLYFFHERRGRHTWPLTEADFAAPAAMAARMLKNLGLLSSAT